MACAAQPVQWKFAPLPSNSSYLQACWGRCASRSECLSGKPPVRPTADIHFSIARIALMLGANGLIYSRRDRRVIKADPSEF